MLTSLWLIVWRAQPHSGNIYPTHPHTPFFGLLEMEKRKRESGLIERSHLEEASLLRPHKQENPYWVPVMWESVCHKHQQTSGFTLQLFLIRQMPRHLYIMFTFHYYQCCVNMKNDCNWLLIIANLVKTILYKSSEEKTNFVFFVIWIIYFQCIYNFNNEINLKEC